MAQPPKQIRSQEEFDDNSDDDGKSTAGESSSSSGGEEIPVSKNSKISRRRRNLQKKKAKAKAKENETTTSQGKINSEERQGKIRNTDSKERRKSNKDETASQREIQNAESLARYKINKEKADSAPTSLINEHVCYLDPDPVSTGPILDVIYIAISNLDTAESVGIYGSVTVTNYKGDTFYFYKRDRDNPQLIKPCVEDEWYHLSLTPCPLAPVTGGKLCFQLADGDVQIFKHEYDMDEAVQNVDQGTFTLEGNGEFRYRFKMVFVKIPFAIIARINAFLYAPRPSNTEDAFFRVHGKISAQKVVFFEDRHGKGRIIKYGVLNGFRQPRSVVAVPIDSEFSVDVELRSGNREITDKSYTTPTGQATTRLHAEYNFRCKARGFKFGFYASWSTQDDLFHFDRQVMASPHHPPPPLPLRTGPESALVEVYSVVLGVGKPSAPRCPDLDVYGTILVLDGDNPSQELYVFDSNRDGPDKLQLTSRNKEPFRTLSLAFPDDRWLLGRHVFMCVKLKDVDDNKLCSGNLSWIRNRDYRKNRRLCDIIKGEDGYFAAVHYAVYEDARKAEVSIECSIGPFSIYGSVFAQYDNHDYHSTYEQEFYRSAIFNRSKVNAMDVKSGSKVSLLRSKVSAPTDCKDIIVPVDLWISTCGDSYERFVFNASTTSAEEVRGCLRVTVKWVK